MPTPNTLRKTMGWIGVGLVALGGAVIFRLGAEGVYDSARDIAVGIKAPEIPNDSIEENLAELGLSIAAGCVGAAAVLKAVQVAKADVRKPEA